MEDEARAGREAAEQRHHLESAVEAAGTQLAEVRVASLVFYHDLLSFRRFYQF